MDNSERVSCRIMSNGIIHKSFLEFLQASRNRESSCDLKEPLLSAVYPVSYVQCLVVYVWERRKIWVI